MSDAKLTYLGAPELEGPRKRRRPDGLLRRVPLAFLLVVALPTLLTVFYYAVLAAPRYVSEAQFVVRAQGQQAPATGGLGLALESVGLSTAATDAYIVHEYMTSRDGLAELNQRIDVERVLAKAPLDIVERYPRPFEGRSDEDLHQAFQRFLTVGYDSTNGISTLRVEAFSREDARAMAEGLLAGGEALVNALNARAERDAIAAAAGRREAALARLAEAQAAMTTFRTREGIVDPEVTVSESAQLTGTLVTTLAQLRAERAQIAAEAPQSPQLASLDNRIAAFERQLAAERARLTGQAGSLAAKVGTYQSLMLNQEIADRELAAATAALLSAQQAADRQKLYLERISGPSEPDRATEPKPFRGTLLVLATMLLIYGLGWLIWSGVREHRQES
jgi:BexC/CtrB/KpsE family polysaccharide export inner-membrane protein